MSTTANPQSTKDKIREMFLSGKILTSCGAAQDFITADLRKYVTTLKREGMDIMDRWVSSATSKRYKEYYLRPKSAPEKTKEPIEMIPVSAPKECSFGAEAPKPCAYIAPPPNSIQQTLFD